jgi:hypothetical protein
MNRRAILFHLKEAKEQLDSTIAAIENDRGYSAGAFQVEMGHLYHHVNSAWNARDVSDKRHWKCSDKDYFNWEKFPKNWELVFGRSAHKNCHKYYI